MTIKDYLDRNDKIREMASNIGIDTEQYKIKTCSLATNFSFVLRKDCYENVKPVMYDGKLVVFTSIQICRYEPCSYCYVDYKNWELYKQEIDNERV